ncbi:NADPH-dependent assimilatory sulfite reductase hemoprotein subunit [Akkermansia glycaniphila]|uniref:assimilatory sulfite reductase (NADPH) n=1 Tax=Akkermansia glycaniphila TaxID=1679444 RepID=A0A1C7P9P1_9BACT|nr:NADPH-dependent assimilatory sulfite reductase hemoprotein subunit [Akkermansia glycaniphila]OCA02270.1 sulfite reductase [Akkermansia glycaniphila]SEH97986.1 nitrite and sulphite reductase 4fe-4s domain [Akkermansia glycaniphila]
MPIKSLSDNERIKLESNCLRGRLAEVFDDTSTGDIPADEQQLIKFHGTYLQDDRDKRIALKREGKDKAWSFMLRLRMPGGKVTPAQWLAMDKLSDTYGNGTMKLTTRQTIQLHGVLKGNMRATMQEIHSIAMDTLATCGDVTRNVTASGTPGDSPAHRAAHDLASLISAELLPKTHAYHEIWLNEEQIYTGEKEEEPMYGKTYLPRKFKIALCVPPQNDIDVFTNDLGFVAIVENGQTVGYDVVAGGGMGCAHNNPATFPRLADAIGFCTPEQVVAVSRAIVELQRDFGDRTDRKHARLKYTIADRGLDWFKTTLVQYLGYALPASRGFKLETSGDTFEGTSRSRTLYIEGGRIAERPGYPLRSALREIAKLHEGTFYLTANQNLVIDGITNQTAAAIDRIIDETKLNSRHTGMRLASIACVALPTCPLALAESERYLPELLDRIDTSLHELGLQNESIITRMTGCPNGCARPYVAELGFVGRAPGKYNVWLGGSHAGERLGYVYRESVKSDDLPALVHDLLSAFRDERQPGESFGDWSLRKRDALLPEAS